MRSFLILFWFVHLIIGQSAFANGFVGSGGDVVSIGGELTLRDLYEAEIDKPFLGTSVDPKILQATIDSFDLVGLGIPVEAFAKKLTDLNSIEPGMADIILLALRSHKIIQVNSLFDLTPKDSLVPDSIRLQVALRRFRKIYLSSPIYFRMDVSQRIALLLHEAFYGLHKMTCIAAICDQHATSVRELVAAVFSAPRSRAELAKMFHERLMIPARDELSFNPLITVKIQSSSLIRELTFDSFKYYLWDVANVCDEFATANVFGDELVLDLKVQKLSSCSLAYASTFGMQSALRMSSQIRTLNIRESNKEFCKQKLNAKISEFVVEYWRLTSPKDLNFCEN